MTTDDVCSRLLVALEEAMDFHESIEETMYAYHRSRGTLCDHCVDPLLVRMREAVRLAKQHGVKPPNSRALNLHAEDAG